MAGCNPSQVPMEARLKLSKQSTEPPLVDATPYKSIIRSLMGADEEEKDAQMEQPSVERG